MDKLIVLKRVIGITSVVLGASALLAPRRMAAVARIQGKGAPEIIAAYGAKEVAAGAALLSPVKPGPFLWARVAGDVFDLVGLGVAARKPGAHKVLLGGLAVAALAMMALDIATAAQASRDDR